MVLTMSINDENLIKMISDNEKAKQFWEKFWVNHFFRGIDVATL